MTCNILYRELGTRVIWRVDAHPTVTRKHLEARLQKFVPGAKFIDYYFGELSEEQWNLTVAHGRFPHEADERIGMVS